MHIEYFWNVAQVGTIARLFQSLWSAVRSLSDEEKTLLGRRIQQLVGTVTIEEFMRWIQSEGHRQLIITLLQEAVKRS